jgi:MerR family copper efflux transcriptional regulator
MRIGELADAAKVNTKTVRYYESIGLMPEPERTPAGYRDYTPDALERLRFIRDSQATGLTLAEIQSVLELKDSGARTCHHTQTLLDEHLADIDAQIRRLQTARRQLLDLAERATGLDPSDCTDPNRCQVIDSHRHPIPSTGRTPTT